MGETYLVTGGAGSSLYVVDELLKRASRSVSIDNFSTGHRRTSQDARRCQLVEGDLRSYERGAPTPLAGVDYVIHRCRFAVCASLGAGPLTTNAVTSPAAHCCWQRATPC